MDVFLLKIETLLRNNFGYPYKIWNKSLIEIIESKMRKQPVNSNINIFKNTKSPVADRMNSLYLYLHP